MTDRTRDFIEGLEQQMNLERGFLSDGILKPFVEDVPETTTLTISCEVN